MSERIVPDHCDVLIAGGGLVGASLALALSQLGVSVVLVEAAPVGAHDHPSFDERTTALSNGSRRIFEALGVWSAMQREATAIRRIHVSERGKFAFARISAEEQGLSALGHVVVNRAMGSALWNALSATPVTVLTSAEVVALDLDDARRVVICRHAEGREQAVRARLVVAADGAHSSVRTAAGVTAQQWDYEQIAVVCNVVPQRFHDFVAYERFTPEGPIALLPISEGRMGLIWTFPAHAAPQVAQLADDLFLARLQDAFGFRLGRFQHVGRRASYPLSLTRADEHIAPRLAMIGNAAQALHPIAGQGFNLGLRDAASLAEVLADAIAESPRDFDPGDGIWLQRYRSWRQDDRTNIVRFTDGLVRLFGQSLAPIRGLRGLGLLAFDLSSTAKNALAQLSVGAAGRIPRLARGAPLREAM